MELVWYGLACFRISDRALKVVTDPYGPDVGVTPPRLRADVVTISHGRPGHNYVKAVRNVRKVFDGPGEYEVGGVFITGVRTWHRGGRNGGQPNTIFLFDFANLTVCHLGDLGHVPKQEEIEDLGPVDVLLVPVGGHQTLDGAEASEVVSLIEPRYVVPMHYALPGFEVELESLDKFLREMGVTEPRQLESLKVGNRSEVSEETQVILLQPRIQEA